MCKFIKQLFKESFKQRATWETSTLFPIEREFYPTITKYVKILATMSISVATAERRFTTLRRLKTCMQSRITQDRLVGLALLHIHREYY